VAVSPPWGFEIAPLLRFAIVERQRRGGDSATPLLVYRGSAEAPILHAPRQTGQPMAATIGARGARSSVWRTVRTAALRASLAATFAIVATAAPTTLASQALPARLTDSVFWKLVTDVSEPGGYFRSDNFVSNETTYQWVIPDLLRTTKPGGVYLGVGPDQNFTYLVALRPKIAFIFDIRRQNMLTHLMYKALLEQSTDRADFLSRLFSRPRPPHVDTLSAPESLFVAYQTVPPDSAAYRKNIASINDQLVKHHGFKLSVDDTASIGYVYRTFVAYGPDITYNSSQNRSGFGRMPSFAQLQIETDSVGLHRSYLASEANFRALKQLEVDNLVVPLVGDFAGPSAIRTVGTYLKDHGATVTAFYLSNVEQYLFQQNDDWHRFYENVNTLPLDSSSTFIRSVFDGGVYYRGAPPFGGYMRARQMLASMLAQVTAFKAGKLTTYGDVIETSR
jgi:hypothetical protein